MSQPPVRAKRAVAALVDTAQIVRQETTGVRVEGTTILETVRSAPFRCRLAMGGPSGERRDQGAVANVLASHELLYETATVDGEEYVELRADDLVEVTSNQPGASGTWQVAAEPLTIRARQELLGLGYVGVRRVKELD